MNKRDLFKGAIGATIAGPEMLRQAAYNPPPATYGPTPNLPPPQVPVGDLLPDPIWTAKHAMMRTAEEEARKIEAAILRKRTSLMRLKSVSDAYREYQTLIFDRERQSIWLRIEEARKFIFG